MSQAWEQEENKNQLSKNLIKTELEFNGNSMPKIICPYCNHEFTSSKRTDIQCSKCNKRFDIDFKNLLNIQEIPTVVIKQSLLLIGRFCKCGCGRQIPSNARKDRVFFNPTCRRVYANSAKGYSDSKNIVMARLKISKPRMLTLYPGKGVVIKINITEQCKDILQICDKIEKQNFSSMVKT